MEEETRDQQDDIEEVRRLLASKSLLIGERTVMKSILAGKAKKVFLAKNCKAIVMKEVERAENIGNVPVVHLDVTNDDLGVLCKKPYAVSIIAVK